MATTLLQVNMECSWHLLFEETAKVWLLSVFGQLTVELSMSRLHTAYLRLVNPRSIKFSPPFCLPWHYSNDKLSQASPIFLYCKWRKAGRGPGNEATLYGQPLNEAWIRAGGCKQSLLRYPQNQNRTCYQECSCHLNQYRLHTCMT